MLKARIGAQKCLLYRIDETLKPASFTEIYRSYRSEMGKLKSYPNPLQGLTEAPENMQEEAFLPDFQYFLCERYDYELWEGKVLLPILCQVASEIQDLHNMGLCHWFLILLTIWQKPQERNKAPETVVVLPTLAPDYSRFIYSFLDNTLTSLLRKLGERSTKGYP
jgi:hypothetical protein